MIGEVFYGSQNNAILGLHNVFSLIFLKRKFSFALITIKKTALSLPLYIPVGLLNDDKHIVLIPLLITIITYVLIWRKQHDRLPIEEQEDDPNKILVKSLFIITGTFLPTWGPHQAINIIISFCGTWSWPYLVFYIMKMMQFINSLMNVVVYSLRIPEYREELFFLILISRSPERELVWSQEWVLIKSKIHLNVINLIENCTLS